MMQRITDCIVDATAAEAEEAVQDASISPPSSSDGGGVAGTTAGRRACVVSCRLTVAMRTLMAVLCILAARVDGIRGGRCWVKIGVIQEQRGTKSLHGFVSAVWDDLRYAKSLSGIELQFENIERKEELVMEDIIKAYMQIGTANISALMGPYTQVAATATHKFGIPYFVINDPGDVFFKPYNLISVLPQSRDKTDIAASLVTKYNWTSVAVIYDSNDGVELIECLVRLPAIRVRAWRIESSSAASSTSSSSSSSTSSASSSSSSASSSASSSSGWSVDEDDLRQTLLRIRQLAMTNLIVVSSEPIAHAVIEMGLRLSMMSKRYSWFLPTLTPNEPLLRRYADAQVNLTTLRLVQSHLPDNEFTAGYYSKREYAAVYDSLLTLYNGIRLHYRANRSCIWIGKENMDAVLTKIEDTGATGVLSFRSDGTRRGYTVNVLSLVPDGLVQIGLWNSSVVDVAHRLYINRSALDAYHHHQTTATGARGALLLGGRRTTLRVAALPEAPWLMTVPNGNEGGGSEGHKGYEGFSVDLLNALAKKLGFSYSLYPVADGQRGERLPNGSWTGLMAEILDQRATLAVGPLMITSAREEFIDFTKPFEAVSLTLLLRKSSSSSDSSSSSNSPSAADFALLYLLRPLSWVVWTLLLAVFVAAGLLLCAVDRLTAAAAAAAAAGATYSADDETPAVGEPSPPSPRTRSLADSFWCVFSSMLLLSPSSSATAAAGPVRSSAASRLLTGALWWFSLVTVTSYAANLAAMITLSRLESDAQPPQLGDVVHHRSPGPLRLLTANGSDVGAFLKNSLLAVEDSDFRTLWNSYASSTDQQGGSDAAAASAAGPASSTSAPTTDWVTVPTLQDGLDALREGSSAGARRQAFLHETSALAHYLERTEKEEEDCHRFMKVTLPRYGVGYGIGVAKDFPHLAEFNAAITSLKTDGTLRQLKDKWWKGGKCLESYDGSGSSVSVGLSVGQMSGLFILLSVGLTLSLVVSVIEYCRHPRYKESHAKKTKRSENNSTKPRQSESATALDVFPLEVLPYPDALTSPLNELIKTGSASSQSRETNF